MTTQAFQPRLSLLLIVRDEAANLRRLLGPIRGEVDEIIVVDTGSSDESLQVAEEAGARVLSHRWAGDFAAARNAGLAAATGDWILVLDADERVPAEQWPKIRQRIAAPADRVYLLEVVGVEDEPIEELQPRLFPGQCGLRFDGRVRERIDDSVRQIGLATHRTDIRILHLFGADRARERSRRGRNHYLLAAEHQRRPDDLLVQLHLARSWLLMGDRRRGTELLEELLYETDCRRRDRALFAFAGVQLALAWEVDGDLAQAEQKLNELLAVVPDDRLAHYHLGRFCWIQRDLAGALEHLDTARDGVPVSRFPVPVRAVNSAIWLYLGRCCEALAQEEPPEMHFWMGGGPQALERAEAAYRQALEIWEGSSGAHLALGALLRKSQRGTEAKAELTRALVIQPDCLDAYFELAHVYAHEGGHEQAIKLFKKTLRLDPGLTPAYVNIANAYFRRGDPSQAEDWYRQALEVDGRDPRIYKNLALVLLALSRPGDALATVEDALEMPRLPSDHRQALEALGEEARRLTESVS